MEAILRSLYVISFSLYTQFLVDEIRLSANTHVEV